MDTVTTELCGLSNKGRCFFAGQIIHQTGYTVLNTAPFYHDHGFHKNKTVLIKLKQQNYKNNNIMNTLEIEQIFLPTKIC